MPREYSLICRFRSSVAQRLRPAETILPDGAALRPMYSYDRFHSGRTRPIAEPAIASAALPRNHGEEADDESWRGISADRTWRRYGRGEGVRASGGRPGLRPYCDL